MGGEKALPVPASQPSKQESQHARRRPLTGAAVHWKAVEELHESLGARRLGQRFTPPMPERRVCQRFLTAEGCPFGERCTHLHQGLNADSGASTPSMEYSGGSESSRPRVCF